MSDVTSTPPDSPSEGVRSAPPRDRAKSSRRRAREYALQGLYEWQLNPREPGAIDADLRDAP